MSHPTISGPRTESERPNGKWRAELGEEGQFAGGVLLLQAVVIAMAALAVERAGVFWWSDAVRRGGFRTVSVSVL